MRDLLWRVCFRRKIWPHQVTGDAKYGTTENIVALEDAGIRAYVPLTDFDHRTDFYGQDDFIFDAGAGRIPLPGGPVRCRYATKRTEGVVVYRGEATICNACPVKAKCTTSDHGRKVQRSFYIDYLEKVRGYHATEAVQEGDPQAPGLGRAALCRSEGVARLTPAATPRLAEREHPGAADRGRTEPEAFPGRDRLGAASCPVWQPFGPPN